MKSLLCLIGFIGLTSAQNRIVSGSDAMPGEFPWVVAIKEVGSGNVFQTCSGAIVDEWNVVTAGSCCTNPGNRFYHITAGDTDNDVFEGTEVDVDVSRHNMHPNFVSTMLHDDICMMRLEEPLNFTANPAIGPVMLPAEGEISPDGTMATLVGWGYVRDNALVRPNILQKANVSVIDNVSCESSYPGKLIPSMMCATGVSCAGDVGGPLVEMGTNKLIGIMSWAEGSCGSLPDVHTRVSNYIQFITTFINNFDDDEEYY